MKNKAKTLIREELLVNNLILCYLWSLTLVITRNGKMVIIRKFCNPENPRIEPQNLGIELALKSCETNIDNLLQYYTYRLFLLFVFVQCTKIILQVRIYCRYFLSIMQNPGFAACNVILHRANLSAGLHHVLRQCRTVARCSALVPRISFRI
jgi:hypothetical protein